MEIAPPRPRGAPVSPRLHPGSAGGSTPIPCLSQRSDQQKNVSTGYLPCQGPLPRPPHEPPPGVPMRPRDWTRGPWPRSVPPETTHPVVPRLLPAHQGQQASPPEGSRPKQGGRASRCPCPVMRRSLVRRMVVQTRPRRRIAACRWWPSPPGRASRPSGHCLPHHRCHSLQVPRGSLLGLQVANQPTRRAVGDGEQPSHGGHWREPAPLPRPRPRLLGWHPAASAHRLVRSPRPWASLAQPPPHVPRQAQPPTRGRAFRARDLPERRTRLRL